MFDDDKDIDDMAKRLAARTAADGRVHLTTLEIKRIQGLRWWVHDRRRRGLPILAPNFTHTELLIAMQPKRFERNQETKDAELKNMTPFDPDNFKDCEAAFRHLCAGIIGANSKPLSYIVRSEAVPTAFVDAEEEITYQLQHTGTAFEMDNTRVYRLLNAYLQDTEGIVWIQAAESSSNGRLAFLDWTGHYNGGETIETNPKGESHNQVLGLQIRTPLIIRHIHGQTDQGIPRIEQKPRRTPVR